MALDRDKINQAAQKFVDKKKYDKAVLELQKLVQADPNDARTLLKIGDLQAKMAAYGEAINTYESVGRLYAQQGFALKAIAVYKQIREIIVKHVPQLEDRYGHITPRLAELYKQLGLVSDALAALDEVATRLQNQQRDREAVGVFEKIVELDPTNPLPHLRLAEALSRIGDGQSAVREFGTAAEQLVLLGRRDDAIKVLERSLHHMADDAQARTCAELYVSRGTREDGLKALAKLQVCFQANPRDLATLGLLSRAFNLIGQAQKGIEVQKEMARIARDSGDQEQFREVVERLLLLAPNDEVVKRLAGQVGTNAGDSGGVAQMRMPDAPAPQQAPPEPELEYLDAEAEPEDYDEIEADEIEEGSAPGDLVVPVVQTSRGGYDAPPSPVRAPDPLPSSRLPRPGQVAGRAAAPPARPAPPPPPPDPAQADQFLADAEAFRRVKLYDRALENVRQARAVAPQRVDVHEVERDLLIEAGRSEEAIETMLRIAAIFVEQLDAEAAAHALQDVLAYEPRNARALEMLHELGYEVVEDEADTGEAAEAYAPPVAQTPAPPTAPPPPSHRSAPLSPRGGAPMSPRGAPLPPARARQLSELSDPFDAPEPGAARTQAPPADAPLPSFDLDNTEEEAPRPTQIPAMDRRSVRARELELDDALEEIEFFLTRGLLEDARIILDQQLALHPNNLLLHERLQELVSQEQAQAGSGARTRPHSDHVYDLENSLEEFDSWIPPPSQGQPQEQVDVEEIFTQFKEGVAKQISVDDSQAHYDLGLAYKEMGLLDDAIREFELAARDAIKYPICSAMIGAIETERGRPEEAIQAYMAGLGAEGLEPQQETMLAYEVALLYEAGREFGEALRFYRQAAQSTPHYRDVDQRIARMQKEMGSMRAAAVGANEDWDAAFDDIIQKR